MYLQGDQFQLTIKHQKGCHNPNYNMVSALNSPVVLLLLLAFSSTQPATAFLADGGMTMLEVEMAERGSFSYVSLPESRMKQLFEKYLTTYSRQVKQCQIC